MKPILPGPQRSCQDLLVILLGKLQAAGCILDFFLPFLPLSLSPKQCGGNNKRYLAKTQFHQRKDGVKKCLICWYRKMDWTIYVGKQD